MGESLDRSCMSGHLRILKSATSAVNVLEPLWNRDDRGLRVEVLSREIIHSDAQCKTVARLAFVQN